MSPFTEKVSELIYLAGNIYCTVVNVKSKKVKVGLSRMILPACLPKRLGQQMFVALGYGCVH